MKTVGLDTRRSGAGRGTPACGRGLRSRISATARRFIGLPALAAVLVGLGPATFAASPRDLIAQGNAHYAVGRYAEALHSYEEAAHRAGSPSAELLHNQAAARFKLGQIGDARELWARAKSMGDAAFEARARYNLGNCDYAEALTAAQSGDKQKALQLLSQAAAEYRNALRLDPTLTDARANLELAHQLKKQIEQSQQEAPQSQPSSEPSSQSESSQPSSEPSTSPTSSESSASQPGQSSPRQSQTQPSETPPSQPGRETEPQEREEQEKGSEPPASRPESQPGALPPAAESLPADSSAEEDRPVTTIYLTPEQAERLLQMVRDAEKARREMLLRQRKASQKPVERDW